MMMIIFTVDKYNVDSDKIVITVLIYEYITIIVIILANIITFITYQKATLS